MTDVVENTPSNMAGQIVDDGEEEESKVRWEVNHIFQAMHSHSFVFAAGNLAHETAGGRDGTRSEQTEGTSGRRGER